MRILVVAMANSVHTARWLEQFDGDDEIEILLYPSIISPTCFSKNWKRLPLILVGLFKFKRAVFCYFPMDKLNTLISLAFKQLRKDKWQEKDLVKVIRKYKPDIIHSLEFQNAGYLCLNAKEKIGPDFPIWIATNWGSDIYLFENLKGHRSKIKSILTQANFYSAECRRDYKLAENLGMTAEPLPVIPNSGGLKIEHLKSLKDKSAAPSKRNLILIKGYQLVFGRALNALEALESIADKLKEQGAEICIFSVTSDVEIAVELFAAKTGIKTKMFKVEDQITHNEMLKLHAKARCYVGVSISDGISTSMLEAMAMGAFPIQTCTSCAEEWLQDGSGFIVPLDNKMLLSEQILQAMTDDNLVDEASEINWQTIIKRIPYDKVQKTARSFYTKAYETLGQ